MKVAFYFADSSQQELNTSIHRCFMPMKVLEEAGHECRIAHVSSLFASKDLSNGMWSDVVVVERLLAAETHKAIKTLTKAGKRVYATFDDAYHIMPGSASRNTWRGGKSANQGRGAILNEFREGLRLCTGAMVPSRVLMEDYRPYQSNMHYVPNYLYPPLWQNPPIKNPDVITIGWGGTTLHVDGWTNSGLIPALGKLCREYPRLQVHLQPPYPEIMEAFRKAGVKFVSGNWQSYEDWPKTVSRFYIGVAPLHGEYDRRRSCLKTLEFATAGVPWVATNDEPYKESMGGTTVRNKADDWYRALNDLITNSGLYELLSLEGKTWATDFSAKCAKHYEGVFNG